MATWENEFTGPGTSARVWLVLQVDVVSQSIVNNTTTLNWYLRMEERVNAGPYRAYNDCVAAATVNSSVYYAGNLNYDFNLTNETIAVASGTIVVSHNSDGTKTIPVSASYDGKSPLGTASVSASMALPTIPRASTPTFSANPVEADTAVTINTNRADSGFTHTIEYNFAGTGWNTIATGVGASTSWTPPLSLLNSIPNSTSGTAQIRTTTYSGVTQIGSPTTVPLTVTVPSSIVPDFDTITHEEAVTLVETEVGAYVRNLSKLALAITDAVGAYSSTITTYKIEVAGQTINAASGTTPNVINQSGTVTITGTITDSRGRTKQKTVDITVLAYTTPSITSYNFSRADSSGTLDPETGDYIRMDLNAAVQSLLVSAVEKNALSYKVYIRAKGAGSWGSPVETVTPGGVTFNSYDYWGTYAIEDSWEIRVEVSDKFNTLVITGAIATAAIFMHWGGDGEGLGVGKFWEQGGLDVKGQIYQNDGAAVIDATDAATTSAQGIVELATNAETLTGTDATRAVTPAALVAALEGRGLSPRNLIRNARFRVNQRIYVSGTSLAVDEFGPDGWKATVGSTQLTLPTAPHGGAMTISGSASKAIRQTIEQAEIVPGDYILAWLGDALGRVYNAGGSVPSYSAAGVNRVAVTLDGTDNVRVEFKVDPAGTSSTLENPVLIRAEEWNGYFPGISYVEDLRQCQRFFYALPIGTSGALNPYRGVGLTSGGIHGEPHPVMMRAAPTVTVLPTDPFPAALYFEFLSESAAAPATRVLTNSGSTAYRLAYGYSTGNNGGSQLPAGFNNGRNTKILWVNAEL